MTRWEYHILTDSVTLEELNRLGAQRWEVVGPITSRVTQGGSLVIKTLLLKRVIKEGSKVREG